jgi:hypothetical protein
MNNQEYYEKLSELIEKKTSLKSISNNLGNEYWKIRCQLTLIGKKMAELDKQIFKLVSEFKKIDFIRNTKKEYKEK